MMKRISDDMLEDDLLNRRHENEWDRKTAEDLRDARARLARYETLVNAVSDMLSARTDEVWRTLGLLKPTRKLSEALEAVKHE